MFHLPSLSLLQLLHEFCNIVKKNENIEDLFATSWECWSPKILSYAKASDRVGTREYVELLSTSKVSKGEHVDMCSVLYMCVYNGHIIMGKQPGHLCIL